MGWSNPYAGQRGSSLSKFMPPTEEAQQFLDKMYPSRVREGTKEWCLDEETNYWESFLSNVSYEKGETPEGYTLEELKQELNDYFEYCLPQRRRMLQKQKINELRAKGMPIPKKLRT